MRFQKGFSHTKTGQGENGCLWETVRISDGEYAWQRLKWEQGWSAEGVERTILWTRHVVIRD